MRLGTAEYAITIIGLLSRERNLVIKLMLRIETKSVIDLW